MRQFWELIVRGRLCRITENTNGFYEVAVFDSELQSVQRMTMPIDATLDGAKASAAQLAMAKPLNSPESPSRIIGAVKWFNVAKGYGFITHDANDIFVHFSSILMDGFKQLSTDEVVEFEVRSAKDGKPRAVNVIRPDSLDSDNYRDMLLRQNDLLAVAMLDGAVRVIQISRDGNWHFVDSYERTHSLLYVRTSESQAYSAAVEEFEALIRGTDTKEQALHDFFQRYPEFLLTDEYCSAHSKIALESDEGTLIPDFVLEPVGQSRLCDLLELKLPTSRVGVFQDRRERFAAAVIEACAQLRTYRDYFEEKSNRERFRTTYGLEAFRPRLYVIIGRRGEVDPLEWRRIEGDIPALHVKTYDDLLERAKHKLDKYGVLKRTIR